MPDLDVIDVKILELLQRNGRMTNQQLCEQVGLSPSPCLRRVRLLEESGVITGYVALVEPQLIGLRVTAFVRIRLDQQDDSHLAAFESAIAGLTEVMDCYLMTGEADYQLRVLVESLEQFENFLRYKLTRIKGVSQVTTSFALRPIVHRTALPISGLHPAKAIWRASA